MSREVRLSRVHVRTDSLSDPTCRSLSVQLLAPLQLRNEHFKKNVASLEKKHAMETKKMKESIKKKKEEMPIMNMDWEDVSNNIMEWSYSEMAEVMDWTDLDCKCYCHRSRLS